MTKNPLTFMQGQFTQWFNSNSGIDAINPVIVIPCMESDAEFQALRDEGVHFFKACEWKEKIHKDDYYIYQIEFDDKEFFLYWEKGFEYKAHTDECIGLIEDTCHFLAHLVFYTSFNIQPNGQLGLIVSDKRVFEQELNNMLPKLLTLSLNRDCASENFETKIIRVLLYVELLNGRHTDICDKIIELSLALPEKDHEWLYFELIRAIRAKNQDSMFLCLYKMLEFFFPLKNVFNLSSRIEYKGSPLELLEYCRSELNWNVNHNYGLRGAKNYASHKFCSHLDINPLSIDETSNDEQKKTKIDQLKSDGLEKLATMRHTLTHQNFKDFEITEDQLSKYITSIIVFLTEAFTHYNQRINSMDKVTESK